MKTKVCTKCGEEKNLNEFYYKDKEKKTLKAHCKICDNERRTKDLKKQKELDPIFKEKERVRQIKKDKKKYENNDLFRLKKNIKRAISGAITRNGYTKHSQLYFILGVEWKFFKSHLESQFKNGMTWENYGEWNNDHKIPLCVARNDDDVIKLNFYKNIQPLWAYENVEKSDKILDEHKWLITELFGGDYILE